jgi:hypothetical protein
MKLTRKQLRRLIRESFSIRKTLFVFDFDDTLAHTDSMVRLERDSELTDLDSGAFAAYSFQPGDQLDFTDFNRVSGKLIANTLAILNNAQRSGQDIVIITARPPGAVPGIQQFFADNNMESPPIYATSGSANKLPVMRNLLIQGDYDHVIVYEDCMKNIEKLGDVVRDMGVSYSAICIDHDTTMRKIYENIILEGYDKSFTCNDMGHSNGFIFPSGNYLDLTETQYNTHDDYLEAMFGDPDHSDYGADWTYNWRDLPNNLIQVSNPKHWSILHPDWSVATAKQIHGMIDCMLSCKNNSPWIKNNIENEQILFLHTGMMATMNYMTFPEFLEIYGNRSHMDRLFNELMG